MITQELKSPFEIASDEIVREHTLSSKVIEDSIARITQDEINLGLAKAEIERVGFNATNFMLEFNRRTNLLPPEIQQALLNGEEISNSEFAKNSKEYKELLSFVEAAKTKTSNLLAELDSYIQNSLDLAMAIALRSIRYELSKIPKSDSRDFQEIKKRYSRLEKSKEDYIKNRSQYGQAKDTLRVTPYNDFFDHLKLLAEKVQFINYGIKPARKNPVSQFFENLAGIPRILTLVPPILAILRGLIFHVQPNEKESPLVTHFNEFIRRLGKFFGETVSVEGAENLPGKTSAKVVHLFMSSHRHGFRDQLGFAHLRVDDVVFFAAVNNFVPESLNKIFGLKTWFIKRLNDDLCLVVVGKGADPDPITKSKIIVTNSPMRKFLLYPEGKLPDTFGSTSPIRDKINDPTGPIGSFQKDGYVVNLVPISMRYNAQIFGGSQPDQPQNLVVKVHPNIPDRARRMLNSIGGTEALGMLFRYGLIDELTTNEQMIWGQVRASKVRKHLDDFLKFKS